MLNRKGLILSVFLLLIAGLTSCTTSDRDVCKTSNDEVSRIIKELIPGSTVIEISPSPIQALCEVVLEARGQKGILYIDKSMKMIVSGSIVDIKTRNDMTNEKLREISRIDTSTIPLDDALLLGRKDAEYRVIVFDDPD
jgi:thiol:disulfide interchange protein DsbC